MLGTSLEKCILIYLARKDTSIISKEQLCITEPIDGKPATVSNGATIGFNIDNTEQGDAWHKAD